MHRTVLDKITKFSDIKVGDFFCFKYELEGRPEFCPGFQKDSDLSYTLNWECPIFNDRRKKKIRPRKLCGVASGDVQVFKITRNNSQWIVQNQSQTY